MSEIDDLRAEIARMKPIYAEMLRLLQLISVTPSKKWLNDVRDVVSKAKG